MGESGCAMDAAGLRGRKAVKAGEAVVAAHVGVLSGQEHVQGAFPRLQVVEVGWVADTKQPCGTVIPVRPRRLHPESNIRVFDLVDVEQVFFVGNTESKHPPVSADGFVDAVGLFVPVPAGDYECGAFGVRVAGMMLHRQSVRVVQVAVQEAAHDVLVPTLGCQMPYRDHVDFSNTTSPGRFM